MPLNVDGKAGKALFGEGKVATLDFAGVSSAMLTRQGSDRKRKAPESPSEGGNVPPIGLPPQNSPAIEAQQEAIAAALKIPVPPQNSPVIEACEESIAGAFMKIPDDVLKRIFQFCDPIQDRFAVSLTCKQFDSALKNIEFGDWLNIFSKHKQNEIFTKLLTTIESNEQFKIKVESYLESYMTRFKALYLSEHYIDTPAKCKALVKALPVNVEVIHLSKTNSEILSKEHLTHFLRELFERIDKPSRADNQRLVEENSCMGKGYHMVRINERVLMNIPVKEDADPYSEKSQVQTLPYLFNRCFFIGGLKCYLRDLAQHPTSHLHLNTNYIDSTDKQEALLTVLPENLQKISISRSSPL